MELLVTLLQIKEKPAGWVRSTLAGALLTPSMQGYRGSSVPCEKPEPVRRSEFFLLHHGN